MAGLSASQQARLRPILPPQVDRYAGLPVVDLCDSDTDVFNFNDPAGGSADELRTGDNVVVAKSAPTTTIMNKTGATSDRRDLRDSASPHSPITTKTPMPHRTRSTTCPPPVNPNPRPARQQDQQPREQLLDQTLVTLQALQERVAALVASRDPRYQCNVNSRILILSRVAPEAVLY